MIGVTTLERRMGETTEASPRQAISEADFNRLYERVASDLWRFLSRLTGDPALSDDIFQKTFFRFLRSNTAIVDESHVRALLHRIAANLVIDHWRREKRERHWFNAPPKISTAKKPEFEFDVRRLLATLKPRERALLWMAHAEEIPHAEIAATLGLAEKSVRVLLFRARRKFAALLRKHGISLEVLA